jgi:hypothetical protein
MSTAVTRSHRFWDPVALAAAGFVVVGGAALAGVVTSHHAAESSAPALPPAPPRTALIIPIPVAPTGVPTTQIATPPTVHRHS